MRLALSTPLSRARSMARNMGSSTAGAATREELVKCPSQGWTPFFWGPPQLRLTVSALLSLLAAMSGLSSPYLILAPTHGPTSHPASTWPLPGREGLGFPRAGDAPVPQAALLLAARWDGSWLSEPALRDPHGQCPLHPGCTRTW